MSQTSKVKTSNRVKELIKNTIIIGIGKFGTQVLNFLLLPLYTGYLSTSEYGNYDLIVVISSFLVPILTLLLEESMFRFLIDAKSEKEKKIIISNTILYCSTICSLFFLIGITLSYFLELKILLLIVIYSIACVLLSLSNAICRGVSKYKLYSISNFVSSLIIIILNIFFITVLNLGYESLIYSTVMANIVVSSIIFFRVKIYKYISFKTCEFNILKKMFKYSWPLVPNTICWSIINLSDRLFIVYFLGPSYNGIYSVSYKFPNIISTFYSFFNVAWTESSAKILNDGNENDKYNYIYENIKKMLFSVTLLLISGISFIYPIFVSNEYVSGIVYIPILALSVYYASMSGFFGGIFTAHKDTKILGFTSLIAAILNTIINAIAIKTLGLYAASLSTLISTYAMYLYRKKKLKKYLILNENKYYKIKSYLILMISLIIFYKFNILIKIIYFVILFIYICIDNKNIILKLKSKFLRKI